MPGETIDTEQNMPGDQDDPPIIGDVETEQPSHGDEDRENQGRS